MGFGVEGKAFNKPQTLNPLSLSLWHQLKCDHPDHLLTAQSRHWLLSQQGIAAARNTLLRISLRFRLQTSAQRCRGALQNSTHRLQSDLQSCRETTQTTLHSSAGRLQSSTCRL